jgi:large subunit ribosomal protein L5
MSKANMMTVKEKAHDAYTALAKEFGYTNKLATPKIVKVVVSTGTGTLMKKDRTKNDFILDRIGKITGQKPSLKAAKKSVASFKIRQGDPVGVMVTLRGKTMYNFLEKLLNIALPRTKDFRGIDSKIVDDIGNVTIPVKEHTIFPETADEELKDVFGMGITIVTTAKNKSEATAFFKHIGVPFKN